MKNGHQNGRGSDGSDPGGHSRRDFLKVLGVAGAGAAAASCGPPETGDRLIPYLIPPDDVVPGSHVTYATVLAGGGPEPLGVHARVREGRVIKLEGNPEAPNEGRLSALAQSALQDLYDPDRVPAPRRREGDGFVEASWEEAIAATASAVGDGRTVLLTGAATGSAAELYAAWADAVGAEWVAWEPLGLEALRTAHEIAFGRREIPAYALDRADRIVSFGADFLETWLAPVELAARWSRARSIEDGRHAKATFVAPRLSLTGQSADEWLPCRTGSEAAVALAVAHEVGRRRGDAAAARTEALLADWTPEAVAGAAGIPAERIRALGEELAAADAPLALPPGIGGQGRTSTDAHLAVAVLNWVLGAVGSTVRFGEGPVRGETATFGRMAALARSLADGEVRTLVVAGVNPAYALPPAAGFAEALDAVPALIAIGPHEDETATRADWILPTHHELEAWNDAELRGGLRAVAQPVMRPVFDTRQREDVLLQVAAAAGTDALAPDWRSWLEGRWRELHGRGPEAARPFAAWWRETLQRGVRRVAAAPAPETPPVLRPAATTHRFAAPPTGDGLSLLAYPTVQFYDGRGANRPWMQELPDPVTKAVWSSWLEIHPDTAAPLGLETGDLVEVRTAAGSATVPAFLYRGIRPDTVAMPIGQGHTAYGRTAAGRGANAFALLPAAFDERSGAFAFAGTAAELRATGRRGRLAVMQGGTDDLGREIAELIEADAARAAVDAHHVDLAEIVEAAWDSDPRSPYRWGMTIDLDACTGCGACVTACYAENNLPAVGEDLCAQGREMSWMQIMTYQEPTEDGFQAAHVPVLCQQCGDAPCEPVCPVYAAYHTPEGLNGQVYNRCVGTRYCANNCPYKVRRFNWFTYEFPYPLNLQLNPDVTVRQKGVMEKCTFCVQRISRAKLAAKDEGRLVEDGEIVTACMQSCPTQAIVFGNLKDPGSRVSRIAKGARAYHMLGELNTRPAVTYLRGVTHARLAEAAHDGGHGAEEEHAAPEAGH